jgi:hypothetical protein
MRRQILLSAMAVVFAALAGGETPAGVPKGAVETKPGVYRLVDKDKKVWIFRKTPFGFQKSAEEPADAPANSEKAEESKAPAAEAERDRTKTPFGKSKASEDGGPVTKVTESGDSITFERPSPFGVYRWTRKKSELTADERKLWEAQRPAQARQ